MYLANYIRPDIIFATNLLVSLAHLLHGDIVIKLMFEAEQALENVCFMKSMKSLYVC